MRLVMQNPSRAILGRQQQLHAEAGASESVWHPVAAVAPTSDSIRQDQARSVALPESWESCLVAIITSERAEHESHLAYAARRERQVAQLFDQLAPAQAVTLRRRLDAARADDPIIIAFARFTAERRARLHAVLVALPRRQRL